jgi:hypothetical protein
MLTKGYVLVLMLMGVMLGMVMLGGAYMLRTRRMVEPQDPDRRIATAPEMGRRS